MGVARRRCSSEYKRRVTLFEIDRGRSLEQTLRLVPWSSNAYWSQRHRHPNWAHEIDLALLRNWRAGTYGQANPLAGRAMRGALLRSAFLEGIRTGAIPRDVRHSLNWSAAAYYQARYRHPDWAHRVDMAHWRAA